MATLLEQCSLLMVPSGFKAGKLFSVIPEDGTGDFTFSRNSTATRTNSAGMIEEMAIDVPRLEYPSCPSLLLEPARTNLALWSEDLSNVAWFKAGATIITNSIIAPNGEVTADRIVEDDTIGGHNIYQNLSLTTGNDYILSFYLKASERGWARVQISGTPVTGSPRAWFNLDDGVVGTGLDVSEFKIVPLIDDWYRCWIKVSAISTGSITANVYLAEGDQSTSYQGIIGYGLYWWGAQLEQGSYPTTYIPTGAATVDRGVEQCYATTTAINSPEGTFLIDVDVLTNETPMDISVSSGSSVNSIQIRLQAAGQIRLRVEVNGSLDVNIGTAYAWGGRMKIATTWQQGKFNMAINGVIELVQNSGDTFADDVLNRIDFSGVSLINPVLGNIKEAQLYPTALTDEQLIQLTT